MAQTLSQTQIIRSLGQALEWFEKELSWGVSPAELNHLTGRIGELYAAMVTRGQMALSTNQRGYDVVSLEGERISVKTITSSNHVKFRASTFHEADRVIILRLVIDDDDVSIEEYLDCPAQDIRDGGANSAGDFVVNIVNSKPSNIGDANKQARQRLPVNELRKLKETASAKYDPFRVIQYENGSILVEENGYPQETTKPLLRQIAKAIGVNHLNGAGNPKNTRTLGSDIIKALQG